MTQPRRTGIDILAQIRARKEELRERIERDRRLRQDFDFLIEKTGLQPHQLLNNRGPESYTLVDDIRRKLNRRFPNVNDPPETEHPMIAVGVVLISAIILRTTDITRLAVFTRYSENFISAINVGGDNTPRLA